MFIFCQILNEPFKNCQRILKFYGLGKISPNLVTLPPISVETSEQKYLAILVAGRDES